MKTLLTATTAALLCACSSGPEPLPETYEEWVAGLGPASADFIPYHADFSFHMEMDLAAMLDGMQGVDLEHEGDGEFDGVMRVDFGGAYDMAAPDLVVFDGTMRFDMGALADQDLEGPVEIGFKVVSDGTIVYVEPDWGSGWMKEAIDGGGQGFSEMVFTARVATVVDFYATFGEMMDAQGGADWFNGRSFSEMMSEGLRIDSWTRMLADYAVIRDFQATEDEVRFTFGLSEEYWDAVEEMAGSDMELLFGGQELFTDIEYVMVADRASGVARSMSTRVDGMMAMDMRMDVERRSPSDWDAEHFRYHLPEGRRTFPVDQFLDLARTILMQSVGTADEGDFEF